MTHADPPPPTHAVGDAASTEPSPTNPSRFAELLQGLDRFLEIDPHGRRTAWLAGRMAAVMHLGEEHRHAVVTAAATHDIGKLFVPAVIRDKPARLTSHEGIVMRFHTVMGRDLLAGMHRHFGARHDFRLQAEVALTHHERWDGTGYPLRLRGTEIPLESRIVAVADVFDALTARRSYKPAWPVHSAIQMIGEERGIQFDPACVDALTTLGAELMRDWTSAAPSFDAAPSRLELDVAC